jgi:multimeric flavodoxin WrbA
MRVIAVVGSPRKGGNTDILVDNIIAGAREQKARVHKFHLQGMDIRPCTACNRCRKHSDAPCVIKDDLTKKVHPILRAADAVIIGTPIYFFTMSAQTKIFMDRCYALGGPQGSRLKGKRVAIAMAYAGDDALDSGALNAYRAFQDTCNWVGAELVGIVHGHGEAKGDIAKNKKLLSAAKELGRELCR